MQWWRVWFIDVEKAALRLLVKIQRRELALMRRYRQYQQQVLDLTRAGDQMVLMLRRLENVLMRIESRLAADDAPPPADSLILILNGVSEMSTRLKFALNFPAVSDDRIANRDVSITLAGQAQVDLPEIGLGAVVLDTVTVDGVAQPLEGDIGQGVAVSVTTVGTAGKRTVRRFEFTLEDPFAPPASADISLTVTAEVPGSTQAPAATPAATPEPTPSPSLPGGSGEPTPTPPAGSGETPAAPTA